MGPFNMVVGLKIIVWLRITLHYLILLLRINRQALFAAFIQVYPFYHTLQRFEFYIYVDFRGWLNEAFVT